MSTQWEQSLEAITDEAIAKVLAPPLTPKDQKDPLREGLALALLRHESPEPRGIPLVPIHEEVATKIAEETTSNKRTSLAHYLDTVTVTLPNGKAQKKDLGPVANTSRLGMDLLALGGRVNDRFPSIPSHLALAQSELVASLRHGVTNSITNKLDPQSPLSEVVARMRYNGDLAMWQEEVSSEVIAHLLEVRPLDCGRWKRIQWRASGDNPCEVARSLYCLPARIKRRLPPYIRKEVKASARWERLQRIISRFGEGRVSKRLFPSVTLPFAFGGRTCYTSVPERTEVPHESEHPQEYAQAIDAGLITLEVKVTQTEGTGGLRGYANYHAKAIALKFAGRYTLSFSHVSEGEKERAFPEPIDYSCSTEETLLRALWEEEDEEGIKQAAREYAKGRKFSPKVPAILVASVCAQDLSAREVASLLGVTEDIVYNARARHLRKFAILALSFTQERASIAGTPRLKVSNFA